MIRDLNNNCYTKDHEKLDIPVETLKDRVRELARYNSISSWKLEKIFENSAYWNDFLTQLRHSISVNAEVKSFEDVSFYEADGVVSRKTILYFELTNLFPTGYTKEKYKLLIDKLYDKISLLRKNIRIPS